MTTQCPECKAWNPEESKFCKKCGTLIEESEEKPISTQTLEVPKEELTTGSTCAERYQIFEELGKSGMGKVYKARGKKIKETVDLKILKLETPVNQKLNKIARILDMDERSSRIYFLTKGDSYERGFEN